MKYDEIIRRVQELGNIRDSAKAEKILHAILGTFGELVYRTEERQMAAQLPKELKDAFYEYQPRERDRGALANYPLEEFFNRIKARAEVSLQDAHRFSAVVFSVLKEAVSPGEIEDVRRELPEEFQKLLDLEARRLAATIPATPVLTSTEYHILPGEHNQWEVRLGEQGERIGTFETKQAAVTHADALADRKRGDWLVIHNIDGSISKREKPSRAVTATHD